MVSCIINFIVYDLATSSPELWGKSLTAYRFAGHCRDMLHKICLHHTCFCSSSKFCQFICCKGSLNHVVLPGFLAPLSHFSLSWNSLLVSLNSRCLLLLITSHSKSNSFPDPTKTQAWMSWKEYKQETTLLPTFSYSSILFVMAFTYSHLLKEIHAKRPKQWGFSTDSRACPRGPRYRNRGFISSFLREKTSSMLQRTPSVPNNHSKKAELNTQLPYYSLKYSSLCGRIYWFVLQTKWQVKIKST